MEELSGGFRSIPSLYFLWFAWNEKKSFLIIYVYGDPLLQHEYISHTHGGEAKVHKCNHSTAQCRDLRVTGLNACNFTGQRFEIINHCLVSNAWMNYACWLRCTSPTVAFNISQNMFLAAINDCLQLFQLSLPTICRCNTWEAFVSVFFFTAHCPLCLYLGRESTHSLWFRKIFWLMLSALDAGGLWSQLPSCCGSQTTEVVIAHKPLSVLITPKDPEGWSVHVSEVLTLCSSVLIATLEAPFIQRCALCYFRPPFYVWALEPSRSTRLEKPESGIK